MAQDEGSLASLFKRVLGLGGSAAAAIGAARRKPRRLSSEDDAGGWQLAAGGRGSDDEPEQQSLAAFYCAQPGTRTKFSITIMDRGDEEADVIDYRDTDVFEDYALGLGEFVQLSHLCEECPGCLAGDRLLLRVRVEVLP